MERETDTRPAMATAAAATSTTTTTTETSATATQEGAEKVTEFFRLYTVSVSFSVLAFLFSIGLLRALHRKDRVGRTVSLASRAHEIRAAGDSPKLSLALSAMAMVSGLGALLLVPFSIVSHEATVRRVSHPSVSWLTSDLVLGLWNHVFWSANLAVYVLMPFAYFFNEAVALFGARQTTSSKLLETILMQLAVVTMLAIFFHLIQQLFGLEFDSLWPLFPFSFGFLSAIGSVFVLVCGPKGMVFLITCSWGMYIPFHMRSRQQEMLNGLESELESCAARIRALQHPVLIEHLFREHRGTALYLMSQGVKKGSQLTKLQTHTLICVEEVVGNSISQQSEPVQWAAYKSGGVNSQPLGSSAPIVLDSLYKEIQRMQENEFHGDATALEDVLRRSADRPTADRWKKVANIVYTSPFEEDRCVEVWDSIKMECSVAVREDVDHFLELERARVQLRIQRVWRSVVLCTFIGF